MDTAAMGSAAMGSAVVDSAAANSAAVDSAAVGSAAVQRALAALELQASQLVGVRASVGHAASVLPSCAADVASGDVWTGPARRALDVGLESLRLLVACATIAVEDALNDTRRAILILRARL